MKRFLKDSYCSICTHSCLQEVCVIEEINELNEEKAHLTFKAGDAIVRQGSFVSQLIYVKRGVVKLVLEGHHNRNTILKIVGQNNFIGISVLGDAKLYPFTVVAINSSEVCFIRKEFILDLLHRNSKFDRFLLEWNTNDHLFLYDKIQTMSTRNSHGKLASILLYLNEFNAELDILNKLSRKELSELATISVESTNKILLQLKNDGIINIQDNRIDIKRIDLIQRLSTVG